MTEENSVLFRHDPVAGDKCAVIGWFIDQLELEMEARGFKAIRRNVSGLGYGSLSYAAKGGRVSVFVLWPARGDKSSWQIRTLYFRHWLSRIIGAPPSDEVMDTVERVRDSIQRFLITHDAKGIRWVSAAEAERELRGS